MTVSLETRLNGYMQKAMPAVGAGVGLVINTYLSPQCATGNEQSLALKDSSWNYLGLPVIGLGLPVIGMLVLGGYGIIASVGEFLPAGFVKNACSSARKLVPGRVIVEKAVENVVPLTSLALGWCVNGRAGMTSALAGLAIHYMSHFAGKQLAGPTAIETKQKLEGERDALKARLNEKEQQLKSQKNKIYAPRNKESIKIEAENAVAVNEIARLAVVIEDLKEALVQCKELIKKQDDTIFQYERVLRTKGLIK
ncbi:MAG: hypothetical protein K940chlam1_00395 [Candidatus Anoxychlamydiales bacterium]|nr:hypothetical protein [Candidatus Anoxychlamydiales bacterium]NGX36318.1 hypothetical protein [Candidatus Anoxychlamydiales bacterium]